MNQGAILAVPACSPGLGGGHLVRCTALVRELRALGRDALLFLPSSVGAAFFQGLFDTQHFDIAWIATEVDLQSKNWECIILDRFQTPQEEYLRWTKLAPVIAIDEGGPYQNYFDFLIDILPGIKPAQPNIADPSLLPLPKKFNPKDPIFTSPLKVLISFGQEDTAGLGSAAAKALATKAAGNLEVTLLRGGLGAKDLEAATWNQGLNVIEKIPKLSERLGEYDLLVTHFGLTAFEALYAGIPVLLISPTKYHEKIAQKTGFHSIGAGKGSAKKIAGLLLDKGGVNRRFLCRLKKRCQTLAAKHNIDRAARQSLAELVNGLRPDFSQNCTACGTEFHTPPIARFSDCTYRRCRHCGTIAMNRLTPPPIEYGREYFFEFYQKQYGKTYIEDFPNLTAMGKERLAMIKPLLPTGTGTASLLDIGCAYGPFLAAARDEGFSPHGLDPAEDAVRYVTQTLGISAVQGFFPCATGDRDRKYEVVTLWYVIEHFRDCVQVLAEIRKVLKPGGVLAIATPSFSGISGRSSWSRFLERSPADHWTIWSPTACKKVLAIAGFKVKKIKVIGHHPERFPFLGKYAPCKKSPVYRLLLAVSRIFALGDTFEVYAVRV